MSMNFKVSYVGTYPYDKLGSALRTYYRYSDCLYQMSYMNEFDIIGSKPEEEMDKFIAERMIELGKTYACVGEIVRYPVAVGYRKHFLSLQENYIGKNTNDDLSKRAVFNVAYCRVRDTLNTRYAIIKVGNDSISYIDGTDDLKTAKSMVFSLINPEIDNCDYDSIYYIRDLETDEYHKCSFTTVDIMGEIAERSSSYQNIFPLYQYVCYGHI